MVQLKSNSLVKARVAIGIFFFVNGFVFATWTSRLPELQDSLSISTAVIGSLLFTHAIGALLSMPLTGWLTTRFGSDWVVRITSLLFTVLFIFLSVFQNILFLGLVFFVVGAMGGAMDVAMNGQGVFVERDWKKPIMSSFHGLFSVGMAAGAGLSVLIVNTNAGLTQHFSYVMLGALMAIIWAVFHTYPDSKTTRINTGSESGGFRLPTLFMLPLAIIAFCGMTGEGSIADWSALYMSNVVGTDESMGALAIGAFATAMTIGRFTGDFLIGKFGRGAMLVANSLLSIFGLGFVLIWVNPFTSLIGFFITGIGLSNVVPIIYSVAGNMKGVTPSAGIAMACSVGYAGFFIGPPTIGYIADLYDLRIGLLFSLALLVSMLVLVFAFKKRLFAGDIDG